MFAVNNILVTDELLDAQFACNLGACLGGCCVQGDSGAPLELDERRELENVFPRVKKYLRQEALDVIEEQGVWEETEPGKYATTCVDNAECVFVFYEGPVAKCAIEKAYLEGRVNFRKPISCHLFPIIAEKFGDVEALNYEQIALCNPAKKHGSKHGIYLINFLREPLVRKYGEDWYKQFRSACKKRRNDLGLTQNDAFEDN